MSNISDRLMVLLDLPRDVLRIEGDDHIAFLHNLCTNDIRRLGSHEGCEAFFANVQGKLLGHGIIYRHDDHASLITSPGQGDRLLQHLDRYIIREDVQLANLSGKFQHTLLSGVDADAWLQTAFPNRSSSGDIANSTMHCETFLKHDFPLTVRSCPYLPPPTYLLEYPRAAPDAAHRMGEFGANSLISPHDFELSRVRAGWPEYGVDIDERNLPQEVARSSTAISFRKGCYLGQETVARIDALGHVNQELRGLVFAGPVDIAPGSTLQIQDKSVGRITSSIYDPLVDQTFALAYLRREYLKTNSPLEFVQGRATVVILSVNDPVPPP
ncbi:MAG: hypothetical protein O2931_11550 [Planctomycetota bacterium]|nr:hypothetical protein [Planctomycetota bacterium]MDA1179420.1 hypothetical protein [Planctomycetota bacterium]